MRERESVCVCVSERERERREREREEREREYEYVLYSAQRLPRCRSLRKFTVKHATNARTYLLRINGRV